MGENLDRIKAAEDVVPLGAIERVKGYVRMFRGRQVHVGGYARKGDGPNHRRDFTTLMGKVSTQATPADEAKWTFPKERTLDPYAKRLPPDAPEDRARFKEPARMSDKELNVAIHWANDYGYAPENPTPKDKARREALMAELDRRNKIKGFGMPESTPLVESLRNRVQPKTLHMIQHAETLDQNRHAASMPEGTHKIGGATYRKIGPNRWQAAVSPEGVELTDEDIDRVLARLRRRVQRSGE